MHLCRNVIPQKRKYEEMKKFKLDGVDEQTKDSSISLIADFDGAEDQIPDAEINKDDIAILPLRNMTLFPGVILPVGIGRKSSMQLLNEAFKQSKFIGVFCQKDDSVEAPEATDLCHVGVAAKVLRILELPDGSKTAILQGFNRLKLVDITQSTPYLRGQVEKLHDEIPSPNDREFTAVVEACKEMAEKVLKTSENNRIDSSFALKNISNKVFLINFLCANIPINNKERITLLNEDFVSARAYKLLTILNREFQFAMLKANIQMRTREELDKQQRDYFLQQELRNILEELGDNSDNEIEELVARSKKKKWSKEVGETFKKELGKLEHMNPQSPDFNVQYNYLDTMLNLPWNEYTNDNFNEVVLTWRRTNNTYFDTLKDCCHVYTYGIDVLKQFSDNGGNLRNVKFRLHNDTDDVFVIADLKDGVYYAKGFTNKKADATTFIPNSSGHIVVKGLEDDTYSLTETATDKGYILLKEAVKIVIKTAENGQCEKCGVKLLTASATVNGKDAGMTDGNAIVPLTVVNNPGFDLPKTGGYGTWMFTIGGMALLGAAAFIVIRSRKHKNEQ